MCGPSNDSRIYEQATGPLKYLGGAFPIASQVLDAQSPPRAPAPAPAPAAAPAPSPAPAAAAAPAAQPGLAASPLTQAFTGGASVVRQPAVSGSPVSYTR